MESAKKPSDCMCCGRTRPTEHHGSDAWGGKVYYCAECFENIPQTQPVDPKIRARAVSYVRSLRLNAK